MYYRIKERTRIYMRNKRVIIIFICFILAGVFIGIIIHNENYLTIEESAERLFEYIYGEKGKEYFAMCTVYNTDGEGAQDTVYHSTQYPAYELDLPDSGSHVQVYCIGSWRKLEYAHFEFFLWNYYMEEGERVYTHATHYSGFAVNRRTGKVIQERNTDENGKWIYNEEYHETFQK